MAAQVLREDPEWVQIPPARPEATFIISRRAYLVARLTASKTGGQKFISPEPCSPAVSGWRVGSDFKTLLL